MVEPPRPHGEERDWDIGVGRTRLDWRSRRRFTRGVVERLAEQLAFARIGDFRELRVNADWTIGAQSRWA